MKRIIIAAVACTLLAGFVFGQAGTVQTPVTTTAPTTGNPVVTYVWEVSTDNGATWAPARTSTGTATVLALPPLVSVRVRVAGVDALGGQGAWSPVSDPHTASAGNPGPCGKPAFAK